MLMKKNNPPINETSLSAIENFWGYGLPKAYKNFLLEFNGGIPKRCVFEFKDNQDGSCINEFFGVINNFNNNIWG